MTEERVENGDASRLIAAQVEGCTPAVRSKSRLPRWLTIWWNSEDR